MKQYSAFELCVYYIAVKRHFTSNYDYFKYQGKVKIRKESFESRRDKFQFYKLSNQSNPKELVLSNVIDDPNIWVGNLFTDEAKEKSLNWTKNNHCISYIFKSDIAYMDDNFDKNFVVTDGSDYPYLLKLFLRKKISLHSFIILCNMTSILSYWNEKIADNVIWPDINRSVMKTHPFLSYNKKKLKKILIDKYAAI